MRNLIINVGFNIAEPLHTLVVRASNDLRAFGSSWVIDDDRFHLHLPVYLFAMPEGNLQKLKNVANEYLGKLKRVKLPFRNVYISSNGLVMLEFENSNGFYDVHLEALSQFNPVRDGQIRERQMRPEYTEGLSLKKRKYLEEFGHVYVKEFYLPHITIANLNGRDLPQEVVDRIRGDFIGLSAEIDRLQIHEARFGDDDRTVLIVDEQIA